MDNRQRPESFFIEDVQQLARDVAEFKQPQRGGLDSVRMYRVFSQNAVDKTVPDVRFANRRFRLTFTPENTDHDTSIVYKMEYKVTQDGTNGMQVEMEREKVVPGTNKQSWLFVLTGSDYYPVPNAYFKFYFWASGKGTFTVTDL